MPAPAPLLIGSITGQSVAGGGGTYDMLGQGVGTPAAPDPRIWVGGDNDLTVLVEMTGAAVGDLGVQVTPYEADGVTNMPMPLPVKSAPATNPAFAGGKVYFAAVFDVSAYDQVRVRLTNNNVGAQTLNRASWQLGTAG